MRIGFSFFSKTKTLLGVQIELNMDTDQEDQSGLPIIQPVVQISIGIVLMYIRFTFNMGKAMSLIDMMASGDAKVMKGTFAKKQDGSKEIESMEQLNIEDAIKELKDKSTKKTEE